MRRLLDLNVIAVVGLVLALGWTGAAQGAVVKNGVEPQAKRQRVQATISGDRLRVDGDARANRITLRLKRGAPQRLLVDVGANGSAEFSFERSKFRKITVRGGAGDDAVRIDERHGSFTNRERTSIVGDGGDDVLTGGRGAETFSGGDGDDRVDPGPGNDRTRLGRGADALRWDANDGFDDVVGGPGSDAVVSNGSAKRESLTASRNGGRLRLLGGPAAKLGADDIERVDFRPRGGADTVTVNDLRGTDVRQTHLDLAGARGGGAGDRGRDNVILNASGGADNVGVSGAGSNVNVSGLAPTVSITHTERANDRLTVNAQGGTDTIDAQGLAAGVIGLTEDGGALEDILLGSADKDVSIGGDGADLIDGGREDDLALLGAGDDTFRWDPGEGSDTVEGQADRDTLLFNGSNANENVDLSANGPRLRFFRDVASVTMDTDEVERVDFNALGGADNVTVNDLSGTDVTQTNLDLAAVLGGGAGDGQADGVTVNATNGEDDVAVSGAGKVNVAGLASAISVAHPQRANDKLTVNARGGEDTVDARSLLAGVIGLTQDGGALEDVLLGSGDDDLIDGGTADDLALLGAGDDTFRWDPGEGSDTVEGQADTDTLLFNGSNASENVDLSAIGQRLRFFRDVASVTMDTDEVERVDFNALGGADNVTVNDLSGTDVTQTNLDLAAVLGGGAGDGQADGVTVNATNGEDVVGVSGDAAGVSVLGLASAVSITHSEPANDRLAVNGRNGADVVEASGLDAGAIGLTEDGGDGDDVLIGSAGPDVILGGIGDDVLIGGPGTDILDGGPGDNIEIQD